MIRGPLIQLLLANGPVQQKVGTRIYPDKYPMKSPRPVLVVSQIAGDRLKSINQGRAGLGQPRMLIWCLADDGDMANALAQIVSDYLDGYTGPTPGGPKIYGMFQQQSSDDYTPPLHADDVGVYATPLEFTVHHSETVGAE